MKLILKKNVEKLGEEGEVVDVKPGYARNYLIPQGLAYLASDANLERLEREREEAEERAKREYLEARRRASQVETVTVTVAKRAGEAGTLFGSVTPAEIAEQLNAASLDFDVDKKDIVLDEPIKELGQHTVTIRLHSRVDQEFSVLVMASEE